MTTVMMSRKWRRAAWRKWRSTASPRLNPRSPNLQVQRLADCLLFLCIISPTAKNENVLAGILLNSMKSRGSCLSHQGSEWDQRVRLGWVHDTNQKLILSSVVEVVSMCDRFTLLLTRFTFMRIDGEPPRHSSNRKDARVFAELQLK